MKTKYKKGGYSAQTANNYINHNLPIYLISNELEKQVKFEDGKPTEEVIAYKAYFSQKGLPPFSIKFNSKVKLPAYMSIVNLDNLQACEVNYNVYFKADDIKEVI
ncbi:hypothetical protein MX003_03545 [Streptococcus uberis]|uniref:SuB0782 undefined product 764400:764714 forward MW:11955 n=1 Tax=Streptococcus uberis TaxID=1349 RepID=A0A6L6G7L2_STRUB|nr:hypothetical protein [Streptococcus uberis]MCK1236778.1 hypothetical protein [Streptococcus uberis]MTB98508.1 hypothetical protein [Streptococcus uberis]MTC84367.1 hypothetical protein [Streptococcus uberis]MTC86720.1 hypothetical protein [Streptococcus uberis]MTD01159.1 hypothetical protein [Streptococcus uberis]